MDQAHKFILKYIEKGVHLDGRHFLDYRQPIKVEQGISKTAEGSARVQIGNTIVMAGVKMEVGTPYPDTPDEGGLVVNAEFYPMSSERFESGPPGIDSIELARIIDRGIREAKSIDVKKLCIRAGEKNWTVTIDVVSINADGNLIDAAGLAALAALKDARFPKFENDKLDYKEKTSKKLPLTREPIPVTVFKIGTVLMIDPTTQEEEIADARLTVTTTEDGKLCSLQKGGEAALTIEEIEKMVEIGIKKGSELRKFLK